MPPRPHSCRRHIHKDMLADRVRTEAYRDALEKNPSLIRGARVLDVGCGTRERSAHAAGMPAGCLPPGC